VCVCVCVYVCVCVHVCGVHIKGSHFPIHCIATSVKEVKILTVNIPVGPLVILCLNVCIKRRGVTPICTVVTTVIGDQIVAEVNGQDMDCKWLVNG